MIVRPVFRMALLAFALTAGVACSDASHYAEGYEPPQDLDSPSPWASFRGPGGNAVAEDADIPTEWSATQNLRWKVDLPGYGTSSPIVLGDKLFLTCYSGYGEGDGDGQLGNLMRHVVCVDRNSGQIVWQKQVAPVCDDERYGGFMALHGYASNTPVTDGENIYVFFGSSGLYGFDLEGNQLWRADAGSGTDGWGSASSPVVYGDLVIVNASVESGALIAFDKKSGEEAWRVDRARRSWGTPIIVEVGDRHECILSMQDEIISVDPATGRSLWEAAGINDYICSSVVANDGIIYAIGARRGAAVAVQAGEVNGERELWRADVGSNVTSPVYLNGHLYWVSDAGIAFCLDAETGERVYRERLGNSGRVYASAVAAGDKLYVVSRENGTFVISASPQFELLAHNELDDDTVFNASPAVANDQLYLRSDRALYCIGDTVPIAAKTSADDAEPSAAVAAIQNAIAADARLSGTRNEATREQPLSTAIEEYVAGLKALDLDAAPQDFRDALATHREAWVKIGAYLKDFSELRGEMHDVFDKVRVETNTTLAEFTRLEKALFDTWADVEASLEKHGVQLN